MTEAEENAMLEKINWKEILRQCINWNRTGMVWVVTFNKGKSFMISDANQPRADLPFSIHYDDVKDLAEK